MKKERFNTPVGEAKWAHVQQPKAPFKDERGGEKGEPKYQIDVVFDANNPEWKAWAGKVMAQVKALPEQKNKATGAVIPKQIPIKKEFDQDEQPTGRYYVTFKTGVTFKPGLFDKFGQPIPETVMIGNGSKVRVNYCENTYEAFGGGVNFYLNAVQVVELVEYQKQTAEGYGFQCEKPVDPLTDSAAPFGVMGKPNADTGNPASDDVPFS